MNARAAALAVLLGLAGCATAPARAPHSRTVEAEGWAALAPGEAGPPRARALADAQRRAVEKAAGVRVAAATRVEQAVAVRQRIWTDAGGRVESWETLEERREDGFLKVRIRAVVRLGDDASAMPPPPGATVRVGAGGPSAAGLRRGLSRAGWSVSDKDADYVATAETRANVSRDARLAPFVSGRVRVTVSLREAASGAVVWESSRDAAGLDSDALTAVAEAGESAGELAGREAGEGLAALLWRR